MITNKQADKGGKLCTKCGPESLPKATVLPLTSNQNMETNQVTSKQPEASQSTPIAIPTGQPLEHSKKLYEAFGISEEEWAFGYEVKYTKGQWVFDLLLRNNLDSSKNSRVRCGAIG